MTDRKPVKVYVQIIDDGMHFVAMTPCRASWPGMRHSEDVRIVMDRAMDHATSCGLCAAKGAAS